MKSNKLPHSENLRVVASCPWVEPLDDCRHVSKYTGVHQSYKNTYPIITTFLLTASDKKRSNKIEIFVSVKFISSGNKVLTSHKHDEYRETFLHVGVGRHISETYAGQRRACEIQCCYVSRPEI